MKMNFGFALLAAQLLSLGFSITCHADVTLTAPDSSNTEIKAIGTPGTYTLNAAGLTAPIPTDYTKLGECPAITYCEDINGQLPAIAGLTAAAGNPCPDACTVTRTMGAGNTSYIPAICPAGYALAGTYNMSPDIVVNPAPIPMPYPITNLDTLDSYFERGYDCKLVDAGPIQKDACVPISSPSGVMDAKAAHTSPSGTYMSYASTSGSTSGTAASTSSPSTSSISTSAAGYMALPTFPGRVNPVNNSTIDLLINGNAGQYIDAKITLWFNITTVVMLAIFSWMGGAVGLFTLLGNLNLSCSAPTMQATPFAGASQCQLIQIDNGDGTFANSIKCPLPAKYKSTSFFYQFGYSQKVAYWHCSQPAGVSYSNYMTPSVAVCVHVKQSWYQKQLPTSPTPTLKLDTQGRPLETLTPVIK